MSFAVKIHPIARPKIDLHFPDFTVNVANRSDVAALEPIHASVNEVRCTTVFKSMNPICVRLFPIACLVS